MKINLKVTMMLIIIIFGLSACSSEESPAASVPEIPEQTEEDATEIPQDSGQEDPDQKEIASVPEGEVVEFATSTLENPVPVGTWAAITVTNGGWPKPAYARISNVITDQDQTQKLIDEYTETSGSEVIPLEEHAEFLDYIVVEYEVFFPAEFTTSDDISFWGLALSRENKQEKWIASNGSNYYWMGSLTTIEAPSLESGYPGNGDTVQCKVAYPMIKGYTDYALRYQERAEDLEEKIDTFFAVD